jgi:cbb3-type cytochrome oxidase cytochrome c subunit
MKQYLINRFVGLEFGNKGIFAQDSCSACHVQIDRNRFNNRGCDEVL